MGSWNTQKFTRLLIHLTHHRIRGEAAGLRNGQNYEIKTFFKSWNGTDFPVRGQVTIPSFLAAISSSACESNQNKRLK
jgi:hypothetical protein